MIDYGGVRTDLYTYSRVDPMTLAEVGGELTVVEGSGNVTYGTETDNYSSARITLYNDAVGNDMVRIRHLVIDGGGNEESETLGTFFLDGSSASAKFGMAQRQSDLYSALYRYTQNALAADFSRPKGYSIIKEVDELVTSEGGKLRILPGVDTTRVHSVPVWFEVGTNVASVLEQLAEWTGCELGVDDDGYITWGPYLTPQEKDVSYTFEEGVNCNYLPGFDLEDTHMDAVNRVVAHFSRETKQGDDPYPLSDSVVVDLPETNPYSYTVLGRHKTYVLSASDPCSHEELRAQAQRYLDEHSGGTQYYTIEHVGITGLRAGQKVRYINSHDATRPLDMECIVEEISMTLGNLCRCRTKMRVV